MADRDFFAGWPPDLVRAFSDPSIKVPHDRKLDMALYVYDNVPSDTASAMTVEDWKQAWMREWQRANVAEYEAERLREELRELQQGGSDGK